MKRQGVVIAVTIVMTLLTMSWYLGWQLHEAQLARVGSFASYYQVLSGYLQTTNNGLKTFVETDSATALADSVSDMQTVERMALPLLGLAPKSMSSFWTDFLDHNWNVVTKSLNRLATSNTYFGSGQLPSNDRAYRQAATEKFQALAAFMKAPAVGQGDVPGVRIRLDQLVQMNKLADELVTIADSYVTNGVLPDKLPQPQISWQGAEAAARQAMNLATAEWKLIGPEKSTTELRLGRDYYYLHFEPTSDYKGEMKGAVAGVDRQSGKLVRMEWTAPVAEGQKPASKSQLEQWAIKATESLPGPKIVLEVATESESQQAALVVPVQAGTPVLVDYVLLSFDLETGAVTKWENYSWGSKPIGKAPLIDQSMARARLVTQQNLDSANIADKGLAIVRSNYTDQPTLAYWFSNAEKDEKNQLQTVEYFINAQNGKLERTGSGW